MSATESKGNFLMFRNTLTELERLVDVRGNLACRHYNQELLEKDYSQELLEEGIAYMLELLSNYDVNTSESNAFEELERLVNMRCKIEELNLDHAWRESSRNGNFFEKMIGTKVDFIQKGSFSEISSEDRVEPMAALERLTAVMSKFSSQEICELVNSKIREVVWRTRAKARPRNCVLL